VNPVGPRGVYDEAKRFAEAMTMAYHSHHGLDVRIVRIFNTYGPRMRPQDGRVVSNFLVQALSGKPLTIYGDGYQTRSFTYVSDEVRGIVDLLDSDYVGPMNIGNDGEFTLNELAKLVLEITGSNSEVVYEPLPVDDPTQRKPDLTLARQVIGFEPQVALREGLERTAEYFAAKLGL
jgi:dTDP-glucose 4,6-dehydratase